MREPLYLYLDIMLILGLPTAKKWDAAIYRYEGALNSSYCERYKYYDRCVSRYGFEHRAYGTKKHHVDYLKKDYEKIRACIIEECRGLTTSKCQDPKKVKEFLDKFIVWEEKWKNEYRMPEPKSIWFKLCKLLGRKEGILKDGCVFYQEEGDTILKQKRNPLLDKGYKVKDINWETFWL